MILYVKNKVFCWFGSRVLSFIVPFCINWPLWICCRLSLFDNIWVLHTMYAAIIVILCIGGPMVILDHLTSRLLFYFSFICYVALCYLMWLLWYRLVCISYSILLTHLFLISVLYHCSWFFIIVKYGLNMCLLFQCMLVSVIPNISKSIKSGTEGRNLGW